MRKLLAAAEYVPDLSTKSTTSSTQEESTFHQRPWTKQTKLELLNNYNTTQGKMGYNTTMKKHYATTTMKKLVYAHFLWASFHIISSNASFQKTCKTPGVTAGFCKEGQNMCLLPSKPQHKHAQISTKNQCPHKLVGPQRD